MRYRLIPTRGMTHTSRWAYADGDECPELRRHAESLSGELEKPVLVVRSPEDGRDIQPLYTVGRKPEDRKVRVR